MEVPSFIESLKVNVPNSHQYPRTLRNVLGHKPYCITVNWKDDLFVLNSQRRQSDFGLVPVRQSNGIIMETPEPTSGKPNIVAFSFNVIRDYADAMKESLTKDWSQYQVENLIDGAVVRLYWYRNQWNVATLKCIDARDANWSSKRSFYDLFIEAAGLSGLDYEKLNKQYCYTFIVRHPSNHMIVKYDKSSLIHLCTVDMSAMSEETNTVGYVLHDIGIPRPNQYNFGAFDDFWTEVQNPVEGPFNEESILGFILTHKVTGDKIKVEKDNYRLARRMKGNCPNINYRVLELLRDDLFNQEGEQRRRFLYFFPQYEGNYTKMETNFQRLVKRIYETYEALYTRSSVSSQQMDPLEKHVLDDLYYTQIEEGRRVGYHRVEKYLRNLSVFRLAYLLGTPYYIPKNKNYNQNKQTSYQVYAPRSNGHNQVYA